MKKSNKNHYLIICDFFRYLPSRFYVITNILLILPLFSKMLSVKEMGLFQIGISLLNLICTIFFDWISKSVLRFYDENKIKNTVEQFFNNIIILFVINYIILAITYIIFRKNICCLLHISQEILLCIMILVIPCLLRQCLYQILRLLNKTMLYTTSIIVYQVLLVLMTLTFIHFGTNNIIAIFASMAIAIMLLDLYIIKNISTKIKIKLKFSNFDTTTINKFLQYGIPLVYTNLFIWAILNYNKYYFQSIGDFNATGELALASFTTNTILASIFSTLLFAVFPRIIKRFETKRNVKTIITDTIKIYFLLFIPLTMLFVFYPNNILNIFSNNQYSTATSILPLFAISLFLHELGKIINIKYHLLNKTHIGTLTAAISGVVCILINTPLALKLGNIGSAIAMTTSLILWLCLNIIINFKNTSFIDYKKVFKTATKTISIGVIAYTLVLPITQIEKQIISEILPICMFIMIYYAITYKLKKFILR